MTEPTDLIRLYMDDDAEPFKTARPPLRFQFTTLHLADGPHRLRIEAHNGLAGVSIREIPFHVRNGVAITVSGIQPGQEIAGQVGIIINAYAGNTEVDFEPHKAETPQPVPTWAWLLFLVVVAWTFFYLMNPVGASTTVPTASAVEHLGGRVYTDTCAKCHQEDGRGLSGLSPPPLRFDPLVLDPDPTEQVTYVVGGPLPERESEDPAGTGRSRIRMPDWGTRLSNEELVAVVNYTRTHWGNGSPTLEPRARRAPEAIANLDGRLIQALQDPKHPAGPIEECYAPGEGEARLVRPAAGTDPRRNDSGRSEVVKALLGWLSGLKELHAMEILDAAYHVEDGQWAYGNGEMIVTTTSASGGRSIARGRFVRMYKWLAEKPDPVTEKAGTWVVTLDFSTIPMPIGCEVTLEPDANCPGGLGDPNFYYADVQAMFNALHVSADSSPHGAFWKMPYATFVNWEFPYPKIPGATIRVLIPKRGAESNLVKALKGGEGIRIDVPGQAPRYESLPQMPFRMKPMPPADIAKIQNWIDRGCPEKAPSPTPPGALPPGTPPTPPGPATPPPPPGPAEVPGPAPSRDEWVADDLDFAGVLQVLKALRKGASGAPHGEFWKMIPDGGSPPTRDEFVAFSFEYPLTLDGKETTVKIPLLVPGKADESNLVRALADGKGVAYVTQDGKTGTFDLDRKMPPGPRKVSDADLERIRRWIDHGAPERRP